MDWEAFGSIKPLHNTSTFCLMDVIEPMDELSRVNGNNAQAST